MHVSSSFTFYEADFRLTIDYCVWSRHRQRGRPLRSPSLGTQVYTPRIAVCVHLFCSYPSHLMGSTKNLAEQAEMGKILTAFCSIDRRMRQY